MLKELSPVEVLLLDLIYNNASKENDYSKRRMIQYSRQKLKSALKQNNEQMDLVLKNLFRLNILQAPGSRGASIGDYPFAHRTLEVFELTTFGYGFITSMKFSSKS